MSNLSLKGFTGIDNNRQTFPRLIDINSNFRYDRLPLLVQDVDAVNNELYNLVYTTPGERPFEPRYGLNLLSKIFEPCDEITAWQIENDLILGLIEWMPHIRLVRNGKDSTRVTARPDWPGFHVRIVYSLSGVNNPNNNTVDFNLLQQG